MIPVYPQLHSGGELITFGNNQPPYIPLPASVDKEGTVMTEWEFTADELQAILDGGRLRLWILFTRVNKGEALCPVAIEIIK